MSFKAELFIFDKVYPVLDLTYTLYRPADLSGRPHSRTNTNGIFITVPSTNDDSDIYEAMFDPVMTFSGEIVFYKRDGMQIDHKLKFANAYMLGAGERFNHNGGMGSENIPLDMHISPLIMELKGTIYESPVNPSNPFITKAPVTVLEEEETRITRVSWADTDTKEEGIEEGKYGQNISLIAEIQKPQGSSVDITIEKEDGTEFENGKKQLTFTETVDENGMVQLDEIAIKEEWEEFKSAEVDKLIAKVSHAGSQKSSAALKVVPKPKVLVEFRPSKDYDGEYGFDWMRDKDKKDKSTYKDILGEHYEYDKVNKKWKEGFKKYPDDKKYESLRDDHYTTQELDWHKDKDGNPIKYVNQWLTLYPGQKATLSLFLETFENVNTEALELKYDTNYLKLSTDEVPGQKKGKELLKDHLQIECVKEFTEDQKIEVLYQDRKMGQLNILKNAKSHRKKMEVVFVRLKTELQSGKKLSGNTRNKSGTCDDELLYKFLRQGYITPEVSEVEFDLTATDQKTNKPLYPELNRDYILLDKTLSATKPKKLLNKYHKNGKSGTDLVTYLEDKFNTAHPEFADAFKVFYAGDRGGKQVKDSAGKDSIQGLNGYAKELNSMAALVFTSKGEQTVTHELLHCMGLKHSFGYKADYAYKQKATYNIMDYSHLRGWDRNHIWLWQIKKLWDNKQVTAEKDNNTEEA